MLTDGLYNLLSTSAAITTLIGTPATRKTTSNGTVNDSGIFFVSAPEGTLAPYIVYSQISGTGNPVFEGEDPLQRGRFEFSCYAVSAKSAKTLARAVKSLLPGLSQTLSDGTIVNEITLASEQDLFEDGPFQYRTTVDVMILFTDIGS